MNKPTQVDLLNASLRPPSEPLRSPSPPPSSRRRVFFIVALFTIFGGVFFLADVVIPGTRLANNFGSSGFFSQLTHLTFSGQKGIVGEANGRINVLLLGIGGAGHEAPLLADTIIVASIAPDTQQLALFSLPRDLVVPYPDGSWRKVNEIYVTAERKNPGSGLAAAAATLEPVLGLQIPYQVLVDFSGFAQLIDAVGGVDVQVDKTFTDPRFPIIGEDENPNYTDRFTKATFTAGLEHMSGERALMYARSRHGNNGEGSDFARAKRQQKLILAVKARVLQANVLLNPLTVNRLATQLSAHLKTNIEPWEGLRLYQMAKDVPTEQITRVTIDDAPGGLLISDINGDGAYVLRPRGGSFDTIKALAANIFATEKVVTEQARIGILNGTLVSGLANRTADQLAAAGYSIVSIANAPEKPVATTTIYDYSNGRRTTDMEALKRLFIGAKVVSAVPAWLAPGAAAIANAPQANMPTQTNADFVITIGTDWATRQPAGTTN
jgi:LCP family protein required for cell wall assembly